MALIGHTKEEGAHFGRQQISRYDAGGGGHSAECDRGLGPWATGRRVLVNSAEEWCYSSAIFHVAHALVMNTGI